MTATRFAVLGPLAAFGLALAAPAQALTMQECSAKYSAAKTAGTLNGKAWNDFRKAECGTDAAATPPATATTTTAQARPADAAKATPTAPAAAAPSGPAKFPAAVDAKYAKETAGKARQKTCLDQYNANKTADANGGLKWIQKGGGYYSQCNTKLKGAA